MSGKRIPIGNRPASDPGAETWVRQGETPGNGADSARRELYTARLTIDVTPALRGRIKVVAFRQGMTVADMLRALLEREYPETEGGA